MRGKLTVSLLTATFVLAGCGEAAPSGTAQPDGAPASVCRPPAGPVSLAYGARANTPDPDLPAGVYDLIDKDAYAGKEITAFDVDGDPSRDVGVTFTPKAANGPAQTKERNAFHDYIASQLAGLRAKTTEADPLRAIDKAGQQAGPGGTVVLVDSGLQTLAPLDFRDGTLLGADPADVSGFLAKNDELPTLKDRTVLLVGVGNTVNPQPALDHHLRDNMIGIWKAIAESAGASCVAVYDQAGGSSPRAGQLPLVTVVKTPPLPSPPAVCGQTILANSGRVGFKTNVAAFLDQKTAEQAIGEIADAMRKGNQKAQLIGTTATDGTAAFRHQLSLDRANAVRDVLVRDGIASSRVTTEGAGTTYRTHVQDIDAKGHLMPGPAQQNRSVVVELSCPNGD